INDKNSKTTIVSYKANEITINTVENKHSTLKLIDVYYTGWTAIVNGEETNIKPYKVFRSVLVPAGTSNVKMYYQPLSFIVAGIISIISWIIITIYLLFSFFKNQKQIRAKLHISKSKVKK
ncbi:MAG: YfhO family protein, partial [bacterium]|nr:YfhO family protein [bacterium]